MNLSIRLGFLEMSREGERLIDDSIDNGDVSASTSAGKKIHGSPVCVLHDDHFDADNYVEGLVEARLFNVRKRPLQDAASAMADAYLVLLSGWCNKRADQIARFMAEQRGRKGHVIVLASGLDRPTIGEILRLGVVAVLPGELHPRQVYRRLAAIMQKDRRRIAIRRLS